VVCERTRTYVSLEVDGELSEFESGFLATHILRCSECREYRAQVRAVAKHMRETPQAVPARSVQLPDRRASRRASLLARYQVGAAAALAVAVVGTASLATQAAIDAEPVSPTSRETVRSAPLNPNVVFSSGDFRRLTRGSGAELVRRSAGFDLIL
jgi:predicted anti-sigma-YlaC factor YlaD